MIGIARMLNHHHDPSLGTVTRKLFAGDRPRVPAAMWARDMPESPQTQRRMFSHMHPTSQSEVSVDGTEKSISHAALFRDATILDEAVQVATNGLDDKPSKALSIPPGRHRYFRIAASLWGGLTLDSRITELPCQENRCQRGQL